MVVWCTVLGMPNTQAVTTLDEAVRAQAQFVSEYTGRIAAQGYTDDDTDYLPGALALLAGLQSDHYASLSHQEGTASREAIAEHGAYPGDYGPQAVFTFLGVQAD